MTIFEKKKTSVLVIEVSVIYTSLPDCCVEREDSGVGTGGQVASDGVQEEGEN